MQKSEIYKFTIKQFFSSYSEDLFDIDNKTDFDALIHMCTEYKKYLKEEKENE